MSKDADDLRDIIRRIDAIGGRDHMTDYLRDVNKSIERDMDELRKRNEAATRRKAAWGLLFLAAWFAAWLAIAAGAVYVAVHFIAKYW